MNTGALTGPHPAEIILAQEQALEAAWNLLPANAPDEARVSVELSCAVLGSMAFESLSAHCYGLSGARQHGAPPELREAIVRAAWRNFTNLAFRAWLLWRDKCVPAVAYSNGPPGFYAAVALTLVNWNGDDHSDDANLRWLVDRCLRDGDHFAVAV